MASVGRPGRALVGALAESELANDARGHVDDFDVVARPRPRGIRDLIEWRRRPGRLIGVPFRRRQPLGTTYTIGVHHVDLRRARAVRYECNLIARGRPG